MRLAQAVRERLLALDLLAPARSSLASAAPVEFVATAQAARFRRVAHELLPALAAPDHSIFTTMPVTNSASFGLSPTPGSLL